MDTCRKGFTLVEIMIVVGIIAVLAAVALPNFIKYGKRSQMTVCIANLKVIQTAYEHARLNGLSVSGADGAVSVSYLVGEGKYIKKHLWCPCDKSKVDGDAYVIGEDEQPLCIAHGSDEEFPHRLTEQ